MTESPMTHEQALDLAAGYVLGALEPAEEAAVRAHLATCAEPHSEFEALGGVVPALLELEDTEMLEPPASLGARIMAAAAADVAAADLAAQPRSPAATAAAGAPIPLPTPAVRSDRDAGRSTADVRSDRDAGREPARTSRLDWALRIAAVIAIVAVGAWGLDLRRQLDAAQRFDRAVASVVQAVAKPGAKTVVLTPADGAKATGIAAVAPDGSVTLALRDLAATTGSQVYEAWVIVGQQAPIAVGGFTVDSNGTAAFTTRPATTPTGAVIAVTLEPKEGNTAPQGPIVSSGVAIAPPAQSS